MSLDRITLALKKGRMVVVYDGDEREGEADLVLAARFATPKAIETLRKDAGGLICAAISKDSASAIKLPFFTELLEKAGGVPAQISCTKTAYGDRPAFSLPINHTGVYTGITDNDRSLTLTKLDEVVSTRPGDFSREFISPGHVFLLIGSGLENRKGHTELSLALCKCFKVMVLCEMLGKGKALPKKAAKAYAEKHKLEFIEGKDIISETTGAP